ncbi:CCR4-NOT transcription complex subunit 4 [Nymphon striatum]|nr:CCR4-NOT transcription complex subunit 4 [Nymphon striatum]
MYSFTSVIYECPLCMEPLDIDDKAFFPCTCGYQDSKEFDEVMGSNPVIVLHVFANRRISVFINALVEMLGRETNISHRSHICRFCWHRIRTDENGLCPACRKQYPEDPADYKPVTHEQISKMKNEKRLLHIQKKQKISDSMKHLNNVRVVQKNLVFVVGLSQRLADPEVLKKPDFFGKFGKVQKVVINHTTSYAGSQGPSASAYVTYHRSEDALRAIENVNNIVCDNRTLKASLGTTKYCSHFLKSQHCQKAVSDPKASFTKDEMQQGKHQDYERELHEIMRASIEKSKERKQTSSSPGVQQDQSLSSNTQTESWPHIQNSESSTELQFQVQNPSHLIIPHKTDSENQDSSDVLKTTNVATEQEVSLNKIQDQISESSQSSSNSPIQYNQTLEAWPPGSSQSSESSDTDSTGTKLTKAEVNNLSNDFVEMKMTNGYSKGYPDVRGSMQNEKPPRFQQQEYVPVSSHVTQPVYPHGLSNSTEVSNPTLNHPCFTSSINESNYRNSSLQNNFLNIKSRNPIQPESITEMMNGTPDPNYARFSLPENSISNESETFNSNPKDDDLGFDPWDESAKGLAVLMEKESIKFSNVQRNMRLANSQSINNTILSRRPCAAPPGFTPNHLNNVNIIDSNKPISREGPAIQSYLSGGVPFISKSSKGEHYAFCTPCRRDISISHGGRHDIVTHAKTSLHKESVDNLSKTSKLTKWVATSNELSTIRAETACLFTSLFIEHKIPVASHVGPLLRKAFPNSGEVKKFS